jgi:acyl dehydratase
MSAYDSLSDAQPLVSGVRAISSDDVSAFAALTGDASALHLDDVAAAAGLYGRRIAHGMLVLSCSIGLAVETGMFADALLAFAGIDKLRFTAPVFIGDTIVVRKQLLEKRPVDAERGIAVFDTRVHNQHGDVVLAYLDKYLLRR